MAKRTPTPEEKIGHAIYDTYRPQSVEEIQTALKKIFAPIFEAALKGELENHLGYPKNGTKVTILMAIRTSWDYGSMKPRASMPGCRSLTKSRAVVSRM